MAGKHRISSFGVAVLTAGAFLSGIAGMGYYFWPEDTAEATAQTAAGSTTPPRPTEQQSASLYAEDDGRSYALWEGLVVEEMNNRVIGESFKTGFDQNLYDFDLGLVLHVTHEDQPVMVRTLFSELANQTHVERVRGIGCKIAQEFIKRAEDGQSGDAPADARAFNQRHCQQPRPAEP